MSTAPHAQPSKRPKRRTGTSDGRPFHSDINEGEEAYAPRSEGYPIPAPAIGHANDPSLTLPVVPRRDYAETIRHPTVQPPQVPPYATHPASYNNYAVPPPPPLDIYNNNSGNATTHSSTDSYNRYKAAVGYGGTLHHGTSSTTAPVVNLHLNMVSGSGYTQPVHSSDYMIPQSSSYSSNQFPGASMPPTRATELDHPYDAPNVDPRYRGPRDTAPDRRRPYQPQASYTYVQEEDVDDQGQEDHGRERRPALKKQPRLPNSEHLPPYQRPRPGDPLPRETPFNYFPHHSGSIEEPWIPTQDTENTYQADAPPQRRRHTTDKQRYAENEQVHGSSSADIYSNARRSKESFRSYSQIEQGDEPIYGSPPTTYLTTSRQTKSSSSDSVQTVRQGPTGGSRPSEREGGYLRQDQDESRTDSIPVARKKDKERFWERESEEPAIDMHPSSSYTDYPKLEGPPPVYYRTNSDRSSMSSGSSNAHSRSYSTPASSLVSPREESQAEPWGSPQEALGPWEGDSRFKGETNKQNRQSRTHDAGPSPSQRSEHANELDASTTQARPRESVDSRGKPIQPEKTSSARSPPRGQEEAILRSWSGPASSQEISAGTDASNIRTPIRRSTNPAYETVPTTAFSSNPPRHATAIYTPTNSQQNHGLSDNLANSNLGTTHFPPAHRYNRDLINQMQHLSISTGPLTTIQETTNPIYPNTSHASHGSVSTIPDKFMSIGNPYLAVVPRKKETESGWPKRRSSTPLEGHIPLYMSSNIVDADTIPMWYPTPKLMGHDRILRGVEVGDIGYLDDSGEFHTIFNIFYSFDANQTRGANPPPPHHFRPLPGNPQEIVKLVDIQKRQFYVSDNIQRVVDPRSNEHYSFSMRRKSGRSGAIIVLPHGGQTASLRSKFFQMPDVKRYFRERAPSWYQHATTQHIPELLNGSLLFVQGTHRARTWGIATFMSKEDVRERQDITFSPSDTRYEYQWDRFDERWKTSAGPAAYELSLLRHNEAPPLNQCIGIIASSVHLDNSTWHTYFERSGLSPTFKKHTRDTGIGRLLSRVSSMSSIRAEHRQPGQRYLASLAENQGYPNANDYDLVRMELR